MTQDALAECLAGAVSPQIAVSRLLLGGLDGAAIARAVTAARPEPATERWTALNGLVHGRERALDRLATELAATGGGNQAAIGGPGGVIAGIAAFFDRAAAHSPEAGVALYSLGDPALLAAATTEIVAWVLATGLIGPASDVLDLGCGIGRVAWALAPHCRSVLGLDVSAAMVAEARRRGPSSAPVRFETTQGRGIEGADAYDLVLAVDSFPYLVQASVADAHVADAASALRDGGALAILNLSYGREPGDDAADAARWALRHGMTLAVCGAQPFTIWDGAAFVLRRED